jgi:REP element-mobilizing transposase RayT
MARPVRIDVADGVYHVISRGTERCDLFREDADRLHFIAKLAEAQARFRLCVYAYVLMDNHFHLIVQTPDANLSRAIQWLKVSYSMWFNAKYRRVGPLFQGRFKSVLVDAHDSWLLELSYYVHLNPVRVKRLGLDKRGVKVEAAGLQGADHALVAERLSVLKEFRWSSYPYYAGYKRCLPEWLTLAPIVARAGSRAEYRRQMEYRLAEGVELALLPSLKIA